MLFSLEKTPSERLMTIILKLESTDFDTHFVKEKTLSSETFFLAIPVDDPQLLVQMHSIRFEQQPLEIRRLAVRKGDLSPPQLAAPKTPRPTTAVHYRLFSPSTPPLGNLRNFKIELTTPGAFALH